MNLKKNLKSIKFRFLYMLRWLPDKTMLKLQYLIKFRKKLNLNNPITFNEKLQWLKVYNRKDIYSMMVDKYEAKKYVSEIIGKEFIIPSLGIYEKFDDINFNELPNQFVIKCTHDSGGLVIVKDKSQLNITKTRKEINSCLKRNFFYHSREWPYKNVKPRILIEKYMKDDNSPNDINDYKFFVFNGQVKCYKIDFDRFSNHRANYYDINSEILKFGEKLYPPNFEKKLKAPNNLKKMITLAEKLATNTPFLRVDFYEINNRIYFGELTFFPASGLEEFVPAEWDKKLGNWLKLDS